jgi:1,2-diacylglycerol 3-alpha-glucosyltransferase
MRIGLFTDTYRPSINGIVFVVESLQTHLEAMGHEVYVFCPARSVRPSKTAERFDEDEYIIRFPSVKGAFYDDYDTSFFFPPRVMMQVRELDLDMIHILTPGQVGLMGIQAAWVNKVPFVIQHCTDLYEFVEHYPAVLPGALALITLVVPFTVRLQGKDIKELIKLYRPRRGATEWNQDIIEKAITIVYSKADAVITLSRKSTDQLASWQQGDKFKYPLVMMPNGVDPIKPASASELKAFRKRWNIDEQDEVYGFVGRLGEEKNLPVLIEALGTVLKSRPHARLLFVGDFEFREELERIAQATTYSDRVTFTGAIARDQLGAAYAAMDVFTFPSLKDTQAWVLHEAALAQLPIVLIDRELSEVFEDGKSGYFASDDARDVADKIVNLLEDPAKRAEFGAYGSTLAQQYTEESQVKKLTDLYETIIQDHQA